MKSKLKTQLLPLIGILAIVIVLPAQAADITETTDWFTTDKTLTITDAGDNGGSGVKETQYKIGDGEWLTYSDPLTLTSTSTIQMRAVDNAGNISELRILTVQIDKDAPSAPVIEKSIEGDWGNDAITCTITDGADPEGGSGVVGSEYKIDDGEWIPYTDPFTVENNATITARTNDIAGNSSTEATTAIQIDRIAPEMPTYEIN